MSNVNNNTNNAANNIDAKSKSLKDILKDRHYKVDYFQREYKWQRDNIEELIVDLERSFNSNYNVEHTPTSVANYNKYYMGPIVLFEDNATFSIVDGQQRLTSFTLLLIFLNHKLAGINGTEDKLKGYIFSDYYGTESYNLNIDGRIEIIDFLFKGKKFDEELLKNESCSNLIERYTDIEELFPLTLSHKEVLPLFVSWLTEKLVFIEIVTQTSESAYTIFETMNDRGLNLTPTEMLKSFLLSKSGGDNKIKELDQLWKSKIGQLKAYHLEGDVDFFKAWLRGKYAVSIRTTERGSTNEDFEKIGTRFHNWIQDNYRKLIHIDGPEDFYLFVSSDFDFYSDVYLKLLSMEFGNEENEHKLKLMYYKGVSISLSHPFILAPIQKIDDENTIDEKINLSVNFLDAFGIYRLLLDEPITHSSIRNGIYIKIKDIRNGDTNSLSDKLREEINGYKDRFLNDINYVPFNGGYSKYLLARLYKSRNLAIPFETINFQRRRDSFLMYKFFTHNDVDAETKLIPDGLKDLFIENLCSYCVIPRSKIAEMEKLTLINRIKELVKNGYIMEFRSIAEVNPNNLKDFFMTRNTRLKENIINYWKI